MCSRHRHMVSLLVRRQARPATHTRTHAYTHTRIHTHSHAHGRAHTHTLFTHSLCPATHPQANQSWDLLLPVHLASRLAGCCVRFAARAARGVGPPRQSRSSPDHTSSLALFAAAAALRCSPRCAPLAAEALAQLTTALAAVAAALKARAAPPGARLLTVERAAEVTALAACCTALATRTPDMEQGATTRESRLVSAVSPVRGVVRRALPRRHRNA